MTDFAVLCAGGIAVRLEGPRDILEAVRSRYPLFLDDRARPGLGLAIERDPSLSWQRPYELATTRQGPKFQIRSSALAAEIDEAAGRGLARLAPARTDSPGANAAVLENLLRVLWSRLAPARGLVLVHAAAVLDPDRGAAWLLYGRSGSGKSTASALSAATGRIVLSDDIVLVGPVRPPGGRPGGIVHGTPFWGDAPAVERRPLAAPLAGLAELVKAPEHAIEFHERPEAVAALLASTPFTETLEPAEADRVLGLIAELCGAVPSFRLRFAKDAGFWNVIR